MARERVAGYITQQKSDAFGVEVEVNRSTMPKVNNLPNGVTEDSQISPFFKGYREVIPPGVIGSEEALDRMEPAPQKVDTVAFYEGEQNDPRLHGAKAVIEDHELANVNFHSYATFEPRTAPMPRAAQDQVCLPYIASERSADPLMTDKNSSEMWSRSDGSPDCNRKDLYGPNVAGVLHNSPQHPGFAAVQSKIEGEGYSAKSAGAILASKTRAASPAAHKANPRLGKVKG